VRMGEEGAWLGRASTVFADFFASTISAAAAAFAVLANLMHTRAHAFVCTHHEAISTKSTNITKIHKKARTSQRSTKSTNIT